MKYKLVASRVLEELRDKLDRQVRESSIADSYLSEILKGNLDATTTFDSTDSKLLPNLEALRVHLKKISASEEERNWLNVGLATFGDILRNKRSLELRQLADEIISNVIKYVGANQGAIFVLNDSNVGDEHLEMIACYAYDRKKHLNKRINTGEGLVGQCVLEREIIYMKHVPENYVAITSGLGLASPREVLIVPMLVNDKVFGVLELASFQEFSQYKIDFLKKLSENIASTIKTARETEKTLALLNSSQQQAEELRAQEEEMRQNMEELQATQEEMQRKANELSRASAEMKSVLNGINATMATIEFTPDGKVLTANENFLKAMKYSILQIQGKHHRMFVPDDVLQDGSYETFWRRLGSGESITGTFKRKSADNRLVWLNAIYNPIVNEKNEVVKVVKFATDITGEQEQNAEMKGILAGIDAMMATIEFTPNGDVIKANKNFLDVLNYTAAQIDGKHHRIFLPADIANSDDYKTFWVRLRAGQPIAGEFRRLTSDGRTVWLKAIYNPIVDSNGNVRKVVKFASDITSIKTAG